LRGMSLHETRQTAVVVFCTVVAFIKFRKAPLAGGENQFVPVRVPSRLSAKSPGTRCRKSINSRCMAITGHDPLDPDLILFIHSQARLRRPRRGTLSLISHYSFPEVPG
jgi:hypothetical protein